MTGRLTLREIMAQARQNWPEAESPGTNVILGLIRLNDILTEETRKVLGAFSLTQAGFEVLTTLRSQPEPRRMTPSELYRSILISSGGMTKVLKQLEADGWILREDNPEDQRSRFVQLTDAGCRHAEASMQAVGQMEEGLLERSLTPEQVRHLGQTLLQAVEQLEKE